MAANRTHKFHHCMCVTDQGEKCRHCKDDPKRGFTPKILTCFAFVIIACDIPKRPCTGACITCARSLEGDRIIIVICDRQAATSAFATIESLVVARTNDCWECWFHNSLFPMRAPCMSVGFKNFSGHERYQS